MSDKNKNNSTNKFIKANLTKFYETKLKLQDLLKIYANNIKTTDLDQATINFEEITNLFNLLIIYKKSLDCYDVYLNDSPYCMQK